MGTAVFYVGLLAVLWLFADLMVHRGRLPDIDDFPVADRQRFEREWQVLSSEDRSTLLHAVCAG